MSWDCHQKVLVAYLLAYRDAMATPWGFHQLVDGPNSADGPMADFQCEGNIRGSGCSE